MVAAPAPTPVIPAGPRHISTLPVDFVARVSQHATDIPRPQWNTARPVLAKSATVKSALKATGIRKPKKTIKFVGDAQVTTAKVSYVDLQWRVEKKERNWYETIHRPHVRADHVLRFFEGSLSMIRTDGVFKAPTRPGNSGPSGGVRRGRFTRFTACFDCRVKIASQFLPVYSLESEEADVDKVFVNEWHRHCREFACDDCLTF